MGEAKDRRKQPGSGGVGATETRRGDDRPLREMLEGLHLVAVTLDDAGRITFCNDFLLRLTGWGREEVTGRDWFDTFLPEECRDEVRRAFFEPALRENVPAHYENEIVTRAGERRLIAWNNTLLRDDRGRVTGTTSIGEDITERSRAEAELRDSRARLAGVVESAMDAIITIDGEQRIVLFNRAAERMFRCPIAEAVGHSLERFIPEAFRAAHRGHVETFGRTGVISRAMAVARPVSGLRADGEEFPVEASISQVEAGGRKLYTVIMRDITERVGAEAELRRQAEIIDLAPVLIRDPEDRITLWNTGSERLYGYSREEAVGRVSHEFLETKFPEPLEEIRAKLYRGGKWEGELVHTGHGGSRITVLSQWVLHKDQQGTPTAILEVNTDVTEKKKIESQFLRAQRLDSIGTLASGIAHDLNNVLSPVMMALEVLRMLHTDEESSTWLKILDESVERGAKMVKQVLSFARGSEGKRVPVNLKHLIADINLIVKETFPKSISLMYDAPANLWSVHADPTQLHQVLMNLVVNARDAMPQGGLLSIEAENRVIDESYAGMNPEARPGRYVVVRVIDTGAGMPPEVVERIFDPFFTTKEPGKGTGLGLSTALTIVKGHGGFITAYSEQAKGTKLSVYIPAAESGEGAPGTQARAALPQGHGELILVVDDEEAIRQTTTKTLEAFGYRVMTAGNGTEAVAAYAQHRDEVAAVICDMMMPFMDGRATILALRRMNPRVKVISSSGLAEAPLLTEEATSLGVNAFLPKPYTAETLLNTLSDMLGGKV